MKAGIVGAGIMGQLLALGLLNAGWKVSLFDKNLGLDQANSSMTAAGLLTPITELVKNNLLIAELGIDAITRYWPEIFQQLNKPVYFQKRGSLLLAPARDQGELTHFVEMIRNKLRHSAYQPEQHIFRLDNITEYEPELGKFGQGYYFPAEGCLDNQTLLQNLQHYLSERGVSFYPTEVKKIIDNTVMVEKFNTSFDRVFDCRGLLAKDNFPNLRGVRGELVFIQTQDVRITRPLRLLNSRYSLYVVPRPQGVYIVGASEIEAEDNGEISVKTLLELLAAAYYLHPGFAEARVLKTMTHSRPTLPDQLPKIKYSQDLIAVNGLYRHGFLIAPSLVADILEFLQTGISSVNYPTLWEPFYD